MKTKDPLGRVSRRQLGLLAAGAAAASVVTPAFAKKAGSKDPAKKAKKITAEDQTKRRQAAPAPHLDASKLSATDRKHAQELATVGAALLAKALLHRRDPKTYPLPADANSPEAHVAKAVAALPNKMFERGFPKLFTAAQGTHRLNRRDKSGDGGGGVDYDHGVLDSLDFKKASIAVDLTKHFPNIVFRPGVLGPVGPQHKYKNVQVLLESVYCDNYTGCCGDDDMVFGSILVGANAHAQAGASFFAGEFDSGSIVGYGDYLLGQFSLSTTSGYPKDFFTIFQLTETDDGDQDAVNHVRDGINAVLAAVGTAVGGVGAAVAAVAAAVVSLITGIISVFIGDDIFAPWSAWLRLNSETQFDPSGLSPVQYTGWITYGDARYQIAYRWAMVA